MGLDKFPLDDGHEINNNLLGPEALKRLMDAFQEVWQALPELDQSLISAFWFGVRFCTYPRTRAPQFVISDALHGGAAAQADGGFRFEFSKRHLDVMPDEVLKGTIAHELAHVRQHADGMMWGRNARDVVEDSADQIMKEWGYDPDKTHEWLDKFTLTGES